MPENAFYYHYKHDPAGTVNNYAYEVTGMGHHTEIDDLDKSAMVIYRPLYAARVYKAGKRFDLRPLHMFIESVTKDGKTIPRFTKITNPKIIAELQIIKDTMYTV